MSTLYLLINVAIVSFLWVCWGMYLHPRVYPITHRELIRKLETRTLERGESRYYLRVCALLPLLMLVAYGSKIFGSEGSRRVTNFVGLRILKLPG